MQKPIENGNSYSQLTPNAAIRKTIAQEAKADINRCWMCGSCDFECPVNMATVRLRPQKLVRMANFGMVDEFLHNPTIWLCLDCGRCTEACS